MSVRVADKFEAMGDFELLDAEDVLVEIDGSTKRLQKAIDDKEIGGGVKIDDEHSSIDTVYSSNKINELLEDKADKTDLVEIDDTSTTAEDKVWSAKKVNDSLVNNIGDLSKLKTVNKSNVVNAINEVAQSGGGGGGSDDYSTEETIVGKWINGKPIYKKTFICNVTLYDGWTNIPNSTISNIELIIQGSVMGLGSTGTPIQMQLDVAYESNNLRVDGSGNGGRTVRYITVYWIRTTD